MRDSRKAAETLFAVATQDSYQVDHVKEGQARILQSH
jgi:hypothetical protein